MIKKLVLDKERGNTLAIRNKINEIIGIVNTIPVQPARCDMDFRARQSGYVPCRYREKGVEICSNNSDCPFKGEII